MDGKSGAGVAMRKVVKSMYRVLYMKKQDRKCVNFTYKINYF